MIDRRKDNLRRGTFSIQETTTIHDERTHLQRVGYCSTTKHKTIHEKFCSAAVDHDKAS